MELDPEPVGQGTYSVLHTVPSEGAWTLRVDAFVDGVYVSESFDVYVNARSSTASDGATSGSPDDGDEGGSFALLFRTAALPVGLFGTLAVALETRGVRSRSG